MTFQKKYKGIPIPTNAREWQLYDMRGCQKVAKEMTKRLKALINKTLLLAEDRTSLNMQSIAKSLHKEKETWELYDYMRFTQGFGTHDTEPRTHVKTVIIDVGKTLLNDPFYNDCCYRVLWEGLPF